MSSTPPPLPLQLSDSPSSPALASPRPTPAPSAFNPFAPILPPPGSRSPFVRVRKAGVVAAAPVGEGNMPKIRAKPFGEIGKESEEWDAVEAGERSAFMPSIRTRERGRPMVRKSFQVRKKDDPATTALGRELGALELAKTELAQMEKEADAEEIRPSPKEMSAEDVKMDSEGAGQAAGEALEVQEGSQTMLEVVDGKQAPNSAE